MSKKTDPGTKVVKAALRKHPDMPALKLAKLVYHHNPEVFLDVDAARSRIRYLRGQHGKKHKAKLKTDEFLRPAGWQGDGRIEGIPESIKQLGEWEPFEIRGTKALVLSDIHAPYHDRDALEIALTEGKRQGCDTVILNGDTLDCHTISQWERDPRSRSLAGEIEDVKAILGVVRREWPKASIVFNEGNHEERWESYFRRKAPELLGIAEFELSECLKFEAFGIDHIPSRYFGRFGKLPVLHGHEFGRSVFSPVNPARGYYLRAKQSMIAGHHHRSSSHSEKSLDGEIVTTFSTGCLCDMHPEYAPVNGWNHGFAIVELTDEDGRYTVHNRKIIEGKLYNA